MNKPTQAERLTRIEVLLEAAVQTRESDRQAMHDKIEEMAADIKQIKENVRKNEEEMAALKNKGTGLLVGAALAGGGALSWLGHVLGLFK